MEEYGLDLFWPTPPRDGAVMKSNEDSLFSFLSPSHMTDDFIDLFSPPSSPVSTLGLPLFPDPCFL